MNDEKRRILGDDTEGRRADDWLTAAISFGVISAAVVLFLFVPTILLDGKIDADRVDAIYKLALLCGAIVTFMTVVWRGLISSRQANYQQRQLGIQQAQLERLAEQHAATVENTLAQQLQKGAELVADEKPARVAAGIATLGAVARTKGARFGMQARDLLLDVIKDKGLKNHNVPAVKRAASELLEAFRTEPAIIHDMITFEADDSPAVPDDHFAEWELIAGVERCVYIGGVFYRQAIDETLLRYMKFERVRFTECTIFDLSKIRGKKCRFYKSTFLHADSASLEEYEFDECDFSETIISVNAPMPDMREGANWYMPGHEPTFIANPGPAIVADQVFNDWYPGAD